MANFNIGDIIDSRYHLKKFLGGGRVGKVYLARDSKTDCETAIKLLTEHPNSDREKNLFTREFAAVKNLNHPGVVKVYEQGPGYFTMEYVAGEGLLDKKESDVSQIFEIGIDITRVLEYIHRQGVIHRDLKPENIKITPMGKVKILDFGFATGHEVANLISSGQYNIAGTLNYMAPEVIKGFQVDPRADLYSLGIIFYELVTGRLPFKSSDILTTVLRQVEMPANPPSQLNPKITPGFEAIIMKLITKSPAKRFQSAEELLTAMLRLAGRSEILRIRVDRGSKFLYPPKFIERDRELERMLAIMKKAMKGRGKFVLIRGEEGMGKSRLIQEFQAMHTMRRTIFLEVRCDPSLSGSLAAVTQIIYNLFKFLEKSESPMLPEVAAKWGPLLLPIVPALTHKPYMFGITPAETVSNEQLLHNLCHFFVEMARKNPLGIFIDDLHWLDNSSCFLLADLVQSSQDHPLFLCGTYRDRGRFKTGEGNFERILQRLKVKKLCEEIVLIPLDHAQINPLVASMIGQEQIPDELLNRLYEVSRGIPALAEETMKNMAEDGLIYRRGGVWQLEIDDMRKIRRPGVLENSLIEKYDKLDSKSVRLLQSAAVIGQRFSKFLLHAVSGVKERDIGIHLPLLIQEGFLTEIVEGMDVELMIGSPNLAEQIYNKIPVKTKQRLHERVARELEIAPPSEQQVSELAHHYFYANQKRKALQYMDAAGDFWEKQYAYSNAIECYEKALQMAQQKDMKEQIITLQKKLGTIYSLSGQHDTALDYYYNGLLLAQSNQVAEEDFHKGIGITCFHKGKFVESKKHFQILLDGLRQKQKDIAEELTLMASVDIAIGDYEEASRLLQEALLSESSHRDKKLQASIYNYCAEIDAMVGRWPNAMNYYLRAFDLLQSSEDHRLKAQIARGIARIHIYKGRNTEAYKYLEDALYFCHLTDDRELRVMVEIDMGLLFEYQGQLIRSREIYQESLELAQDLDMQLGQAHAWMHLGRIDNWYEKTLEGIERLQTAMEVFQSLNIKWAMAECYQLLGEAYISQGEYDTGLKMLKSGEQILDGLNMTWKLIPIYTDMSIAYRKTGKSDRANIQLNKALNLAKRYDDDIMLGKIHTEYALFCVDSSLNNEAREHFTTARVYLDRTTCLLELGRTYFEYGKALLEFERKGDYGFIKGAMHQLQKAKDIYREAGLPSLLNKTLLLIKECEREKSDTFYQRDLAVKIREFGREIADMESEGQRQLQDLKQKLEQQIGDDMDQESALAQMQKQITEVETNLAKKLEHLRAQNAGLLSQVEDLKAERESLLTLQKISNTINSVLDSQKLLNLVMDMVISELRAERGFLVLKEGNESFVFKAARNIDKQELSDDEFLLSRSIVKKVIKTGEPVLTSDAQADSRFQSESIVDLKLRSILCVPFKIKERVIGAVYLDNRFVSGLFTDRDLDFLIAFSNQAAIAIENAFLYEELREKERMEQEISIAARIQAGLLPTTLPCVPGIEVYGKMIPARKVGGDYYDFIVSPDNTTLSLVIGDVSGKGIPAGLVMVMARLILHLFLRDTKACPRETLLAANRLLKENTEPFIFMSLLLARWDSQSEKFIYAGAGHENLLICRKNEEIEVIPAGGVVLGIKDTIDDMIEEKELHLEAGDSIILYTDGITECMSGSGDMLELDGFLEMVRNHLGKSPRDTVFCLLEEIKEYMGGREQHDDITLTVARKL